MANTTTRFHPEKPEYVELSGKGLTSAQVVAVARGGVKVKLAPAGRKRAEQAHEAIMQIAKRRPVYGQSTGVGANKTAKVTEAAADHGLRLLRSHAAGAGTEVSPELARAMLLVRLNQLAAGGSGVNPALLDVLVKAINRGLTPPITRYGAIGTGDLTALATTALCVMGERPWRSPTSSDAGQGGPLPAYQMGNTDALAFMSSSAATLAEAALACHDIGQLLHASTTVAALSFLALGGSGEAYTSVVHEARPHPGQQLVATDLRRLLGRDLERPARRIQDPYGLRALPQVHGPAIEAAERLERILAIELNAAGENPLVSPVADDIFHHGNFHMAYLGQALDALRAAVYSTAALSAARLGELMEPEMTTLRPFLAAGPEASSGLLITEYVSHSALAELRHLATPNSLGNAVLSRGAEEHASFATHSAWHTTEVIPVYETVLGCELVAAVRALREQKIVPSGRRLRTAFEKATAALDPDTADRPLDADIAAAACLREF